MSLSDVFLEDQILASELKQVISTSPGLVEGLKEIWLAIRADGDSTNPDIPFGDGSKENPFAANTPESFGHIMRNFGLADTIVHLGPGIFRTRGTNGEGYVTDDGNKLWSPRSGQRIIGAGMFSTTLQFVWDLSTIGHPGQRHYMIRSPSFLSSWEISDLTLDSNLQNPQAVPFDPDLVAHSESATADITSGSAVVTPSVQLFVNSDMIGKLIYLYDPVPNPITHVHFTFTAKITCFASSPDRLTIDRNAPETRTGLKFWVYGAKFSVTALAVPGDNIRIKRVRLINFGTRTPFLFNGAMQPDEEGAPNRSYEGFPLRYGGRTVEGATPPSFAPVCEDCVFEQPFTGPAREVTALVASGGIYGDGVHPLHLQPVGAVTRHCYLNFDFVNPKPGNPVPIRLASSTGSSVTLTTRFPHHLAVNRNQSSRRNSTSPQFSQVKTILSGPRTRKRPGTKRGLRNSRSAIWPSPRPVRKFARQVTSSAGTYSSPVIFIASR